MDDLRETLPAIQRLALAYAPARTRDATLALLALDGRLAGVLRSASEPMLAQIRLAWWRDILGREAAERPSGEPLVALLEPWGREAGELVALVDGWEQLVETESFGPAKCAPSAGDGGPHGRGWPALPDVTRCRTRRGLRARAGPLPTWHRAFPLPPSVMSPRGWSANMTGARLRCRARCARWQSCTALHAGAGEDPPRMRAPCLSPCGSGCSDGKVL